MKVRETRELARIRNELRARLMTRREDGATEILARLRAAAERAGHIELRSEYERWRLRFEMLAHAA